jgi:type II secretory pathway pseudopilin PulG
MIKVLIALAFTFPAIHGGEAQAAKTQDVFTDPIRKQLEDQREAEAKKQANQLREQTKQRLAQERAAAKAEAERQAAEKAAREKAEAEEKARQAQEAAKLAAQQRQEAQSEDYATQSQASAQGQNTATYSYGQFMTMGVINWGGFKFTWYSQQVLPGGGLNIPGRHTSGGFVRDGEGYIVLAGSAAKGTVYQTPFGSPGKIYDRGTTGNHLDVYTQ